MGPSAPVRVDNVTGLRRFAVEAYGYGVAAFVMALLALTRRTVRFVHVGAVPAPDAVPAIVCAWHEHLPAVFAVLMPAKAPTIWMNHPGWIMRPVHIVLRWSGVEKLALGTSGHGGQAALAQVVKAVSAGDSTFLNPDGPRGPAHVMKDGALDLAIETGRPITAVSFRYRRAFRLPTWDGKWMPVPLGVVEVRWAAPRVVTEPTRDEARAGLTRALDGESPSA